MFKKIILSIVLICVAATGSALTLRGAIGLGAINAFNATVSNALNIQVGTVVMFFNFFFVALQIVLLGKAFRKIQLLQIVLSFVFGYIINFIYYGVLSDIELTSYVMQFAVFLTGVFILTFGVAAVLVIDLVAFPIEAAVQVVADKMNKDFVKLRQLFDVLCIGGALILAFVFGVPILVREGTVVQALIFGPALGFFMARLKKIFAKHGLVYCPRSENGKSVQDLKVTANEF
ncbi:MAG: DUF6198 family protein [Turicibacter sp.]|nr:DUF6198 family protein [Turicibacter sp.]